jgi:murein peptide amidase A
VALSRTIAVAGAVAPSASPQDVRVLVGHSVDHRPIWAVRVGSATAPHTMLVVGSIAGDEPGGIAVVDALARLAPLSGVQLWLVADMNPDGIEQKSRRNAHGVDLNRNFPFDWRRGTPAGSRYDPGPRPLSEPESRAIASFILRLRPAITVWLHQPYGLVDDSEGPLWAERLVSSATGLALARLADYPGSAIGWENRLRPRSAFDVELPGGSMSPSAVARDDAALRAVAEELVRSARPRR